MHSKSIHAESLLSYILQVYALYQVHRLIDREFEFYEFFSFLKFYEFYEFFFG